MAHACDRSESRGGPKAEETKGADLQEEEEEEEEEVCFPRHCVQR